MTNLPVWWGDGGLMGGMILKLGGGGGGVDTPLCTMLLNTMVKFSKNTYILAEHSINHLKSVDGMIECCNVQQKYKCFFKVKFTIMFSKANND